MAKQRLEHVRDTLVTLDFLVEFVTLSEEKRVSDELAVAVRLLDFPTLIVYQPEQRRGCGREYVFNRGKSCSFKMNLDSLLSQLSSNPLSAMVLDVKEEIPKLLGTCLIPLANVVHRIRGNVGVSSHGERGTVHLRDLKGDTAGSMSLSYKVSAAGACLPERKVSTHKHSAPPPGEVVSGGDKAPSATQGETGKSTDEQKTEQHSCTSKEYKNTFNENVFCPPYLYYSNSGDNKLEGWETNISPEAYTYKDSCSEDAHSPVRDIVAVKSSQDSVVANVPGDALRQLPLLNALLVELSQLSGQNSRQPLSIHPNLACIYRPISTETAAAQVNVPRMAESSQNTKQQAFPSPRYHSTPVTSPDRVQKSNQEEAVTSVKKKLVYRTTKTYRLRLKKNCAAINQRECVTLIQNTASKEKSLKVKTGKRECVNVHTSLANLRVSTEEKRKSPQMSERSSTLDTEKNLPVPGDVVAPLRDKAERHSDSNLSRSESEEEKSRSSRRSQRSPLNSYYLNSSREESEEANYADDFNSLDPTDSCSPDLASSPEHARARTPKSPARPGFGDSNAALRRMALPVPTVAHGSPHQTQSGTRAPTLARALRLSSDESAGSTNSKKTESIRGASSKDSDGSSEGRKLRKNSGHSTESVSSFHYLSEEEENDQLGTLDFRKEYQHISHLVANKLPGYTM